MLRELMNLPLPFRRSRFWTWLVAIARRRNLMVDHFVGHRLREVREYAGYSYDDIACLLSVPPGEIFKMEAGHKRINASQLYVLAQYFDVPVAEFFNGFGGAR